MARNTHQINSKQLLRTLMKTLIEWHYRDRLLSALAANHGRQTGRNKAVSAQRLFYMDEREEGTRHHLEEVDPCIETFGATLTLLCGYMVARLD